MLAKDVNTTIMEVEGLVLTASINNRATNATNITQILKDLQYLVQSNIDKWVFQIQRMLADELDQYKEKDNRYVDNNIQEIQEIYIEKKRRKRKKQLKMKK